jgi:hypothetical protein
MFVSLLPAAINSRIPLRRYYSSSDRPFSLHKMRKRLEDSVLFFLSFNLKISTKPTNFLRHIRVWEASKDEYRVGLKKL